MITLRNSIDIRLALEWVVRRILDLIGEGFWREGCFKILLEFCFVVLIVFYFENFYLIFGRLKFRKSSNQTFNRCKPAWLKYKIKILRNIFKRIWERTFKIKPQSCYDRFQRSYSKITFNPIYSKIFCSASKYFYKTSKKLWKIILLKIASINPRPTWRNNIQHVKTTWRTYKFLND